MERASRRPRAYLIDRDGVLNRRKSAGPRPEALAWIRELSARGLPFLVASNHSTSSPRQAALQLQAEGFPATEGQLHTPLSVLRERWRGGSPGRVFLRGDPAVARFVEELGAELVDCARADTVLLTFDPTLDRAALCEIIEAVRGGGSQLLTAHVNRLFLGSRGRLEPGLGAWVRAIEYASGVRAEVLGKPAPRYYELALRRLGVSAPEALMVSDDPFEDLGGAAALGIPTAFVTTGKYGREALERLGPGGLAPRPGLVVEGIEELEL